jgi:hypothetical protein
MKLLIIAGPYEADRIRRAAVSAGVESVAVEPGESLSGWITASRPDLIVMAPQIVNPDPSVAVGKVRAVPRGRVPIFLIGDAAEEERLKGLGDGFFVRPIAIDQLLARVHDRLAREGDTVLDRRAGPPGEGGSGPIPVEVAAVGSGPKSGPVLAGGKRPLPSLKPLVSASDASGPVVVAKPRVTESSALFMKLAESIDATLDAEMYDVARSVGALRRAPPPPPPPPPSGRRPPEEDLERTPMVSPTAVVAHAAFSAETASEALAELGEGGEQKTVQVSRDTFVRLMGDRAQAAKLTDVVVGTPAPVESGKIAVDSDVAALLGRMALQRLTGRLTLRRGGVDKTITFDRGTPVLAASSDPQDRMGEMLVRQGRVTVAQQAQAAAMLATSEGRRFGGLLVDSGVLKLSELTELVCRHYEEIIHSVFAWEDGEWLLGPEQAPEDENVLLTEHPAALILEGIRRKYGVTRLRRCLGGGGQIFRIPAAEATSEILLRMRLDHEERALVALFDGVRSLDEIRAVSTAPEEGVYCLAWALFVLGHLERVDQRADQAAATASVAAGGAGSGGHSNGQVEAARARDRAIDRARVLARYALVEEGDYFQVLGVSRSANAHEVRRAHQALMRELAPGALDPALAAELGAELRAIRAVLDEALRVLGEGPLRARYEAAVPAAGAPRTG